MSIEPIEGDEHFHQALVKLVPPLWGKPRVASLLLSVIRRVQEFEADVWPIFDAYNINTADDARLAILGRVIGQPNLRWDTETYRAIIRGKIRANRSRGLPDDLIEVLHLIVGTPALVQIEYYSPATAFVALEPGVTFEAGAAEFLLPKTRAAGVQLHFFWSDDPDAAIWDVSTWDGGDVYWNEQIL